MKVYHTTRCGNENRIVDEGWLVYDTATHGRLYGTGIYFWKSLDDAHAFGKKYFPNDYAIVEEHIPFRNYLYYDWGKRIPNNDDSIAFSKALLARGYELVIVSKNYMAQTTMKPVIDDVLIWLIDIDKPFIEVNH